MFCNFKEIMWVSISVANTGLENLTTALNPLCQGSPCELLKLILHFNLYGDKCSLRQCIGV